jgi:hypothetical protein
MSRVFIVEPPCVNVEKAKKYGKLIILLQDQPRVSAIDCDYYAGSAIEALEKQEYNPKEDFFCLVGAMSSVTVVVAAMITRWGSIRALIFNGSRGEYVLRTLGKWRYREKWTDVEQQLD